MATGSGIQALNQYGGLTLVCDDDSFARLYALVRAEVAGEHSADVRFISIRKASLERESPKPMTWWEVANFALCLVASGVVNVFGVIGLYKWWTCP